MPSISTLVTDPDAFFRDRSESPSWVGPALVVTLIAILGVVAGVIRIRTMGQIFEQIVADTEGGGDFTGFFQAFQLAGIVIGFVVTYVVWLLYGAYFYGASALFDGNGGFTATLKLVGWGFVPSLVGSLLNLLIVVYRFRIRGFDVPSNLSGQAAAQYMQQINSGPLVTLAAVLGIVFTLWSGLLWTFAVKHARQLSTRNAAITVVLPVLIGLGVGGFAVFNAL